MFSDGYLLKNFREALQEEWKVSISHRCKLNVLFEETTARVDYPSGLNGWNIIPDSANCVVSCELINVQVSNCFVQFLQEDVGYSNPDALSMYDYPPRFIFEIMPTVNAEPCALPLRLTGMMKEIDFQVSLKSTKDTAISGKPKG